MLQAPLQAAGSRPTLPLATDPAPASSTLDLDGDELVGVELSTALRCQAMTWWNPDLAVRAIRAE